MYNPIQFIGYEYSRGGLCHGILTIKVYGEIVKFPQGALISGGNVGFDENNDEFVTAGPWDIELPQSLEELRTEILEVINDNIPQGCCGACL